MSSSLQPHDAASTLAGLRQELDRLDDALHAVLMDRAAVVERVASSAGKGRVALRPGREAAIVRRLLAHHSGRFPRSSLVRMWRELICGNTALQGALLLAVCDPDPACGYTAATREHFGALAPLRVYRSPGQAIAEVSAGSATAAVLPMPFDGETPGAAWWTALLQKDEPRIHVTARLPFWSPRPEGAPKVQALVICTVPPDPSGADRSLLGFEVALDVSRARLGAALTAAGFEPGVTILRRDPGAPVAQVLVDVDGFVTDQDPRLAAVTPVPYPPIVVGVYAIPLESGR